MAATTAKAMIFSMSTLDHSLDPRSNWVPVSKYFNSAFASGIERRQESRHALAPIGQKAQPAAAVRSRKTERSRGAGSGPRQFRLKARTPSSSRCYLISHAKATDRRWDRRRWLRRKRGIHFPTDQISTWPDLKMRVI